MKKSLLTVAIALMVLFSFAQTGDPLRDKLDTIFKFIDKSQVPTGYLKEYGSEMVPVHLFNGLLTDSNKVESLDILRYAYADLATAKIVTALPAMQPLSTFNTNLDTARNQGNSTVAVLFGQYASLKPTALSQNLLSVSYQQFYDVVGRSQSPYVQNNLFAAAVTEKYFTDTVRLKWSTALYYSNTSASLQSISIDFKDGNGYQLITSTGVTKVYTDSTGSKPVGFKAIFSNGLTLYCHSSLTIKVTTGGSGRYVDTDPYGVTININSLPGASAYNDFQDKLQIRYSVGNPTRTNSNPALRKLRKPILYVEGYDVSGKSGTTNSMGQLIGADLGYNLKSLIKIDVNPDKNGEWIRLANPPSNYDFMHDLDDVAGYDLVFVNYNTLRSIQDNALMLQQVINWVNSQKASIGSTEKNVVVGVSMGGLVARYCLANMTKNVGFNSTDTKILITHDSPHQGANVPLGFQFFLYNLAYTKVLGSYVKDKNEDIREFLALNDKISTQQLLKARAVVTAGDNIGISMNSFLNGTNNPYHQMVDLPQSQRPYKFVATSQGSQCGNNVFDGSNVTLASQDGLFSAIRLYYYWAGAKYWLNTTIKSLPSAGVNTILDYKMEARLSILGVGLGWRTVKEAHPANPLNFVNWDGAPGGTQSIKSRTDGGLSKGLENVSPWWLYSILSAKAGLSLDIVKDQFSFVSVSSALDAPESTPPNTVFNYVLFGNNNTRVDKYVSQEFYQNSNNIFHTDYTPRNAKWIYNEMENITQTVSCLDHCGITTINGPLTLCGTNTYRVLNLPPGSTVIWSATPAGLVNFGSPNLPQTTVSQTGSGTATLRVTISNTCNSPAVTKVISVGAPSPNSYSVLGAGTVYASAGYYYTAGYLGNATFVTNPFWRVPAGWTIVSGQGTNNIQVMTGNTGGAVELDFDDVCGERSGVFKTVQIGVGGPAPLIVTDPQSRQSSTAVLTILATPNPANNYVTIALVSQEKGIKGNTKNVIKQIRITDKTGMQKRQFSFKSRNSSQNISLSGLAPDTYVVQVFNGEQWLSSKLMVL